jgi:hypothetical protein
MAESSSCSKFHPPRTPTAKSNSHTKTFTVAGSRDLRRKRVYSWARCSSKRQYSHEHDVLLQQAKCVHTSINTLLYSVKEMVYLDQVILYEDSIIEVTHVGGCLRVSCAEQAWVFARYLLLQTVKNLRLWALAEDNIINYTDEFLVLQCSTLSRI